MTTQERFSETYRDVKTLLSMSAAYAGNRDKSCALAVVNEWLDIDSDLKYADALQRDSTHRVILNHLQMSLNARIAACPTLVFIAMVEQGTKIGKALAEAPIWVIDSRVLVRPERYHRVEKALRSIYEFQPHHSDALKKVIEAS